MQHLIRSDIVQHYGDGLRWVQSRSHGDELALRQAHVLCIAPMDRHGRDCLAKSEVPHTSPELVDGSDEIPSRRVGHVWCFGVDALARKDVWYADPRR